jgi:hypothetical protein
MTITATAPITLANVMTELRTVTPGRAYPISLGDSDVRALAGIPSGAISLSDLKGKSAYVAMSGAGVPASFTADSEFSAGTATCNPSVTVSNGSGGYTFLWSFTSNPNSCTLGSATSQTCSVSHAYSRHAIGSASATLQCVITDSTLHTITVSGVTADLDWADHT